MGSGIVIDLLFAAVQVPELAELTDETPTAVQLASLVALVLLFAASVARRGIRRFAGEIREGLGWTHDHAHGHGNA